MPFKRTDRSLTETDFVLAMLAALQSLGERYFDLNRRTHDNCDLAFHLSMEQAYASLRDEPSIDLLFVVCCDWAHGASDTVAEAVGFAKTLRVARWEPPGNGLLLTADDRWISERLKHSPLTKERWLELARIFRRDYLKSRADRPGVRQIEGIRMGHLTARR